MRSTLLLSCFSLSALASTTDAQLLNGGFERGTPLVAFPFEFGVWGVDQVAFVPAEMGITPAEGVQMARFEATTLGAAAVGDVADIWNLADLSPWSALVAAGHAHVRVSALYNRVAGDDCVDTRFGLQLQAHAGDPADYPFEWPDPVTSSPFEDVFTDAAPTTWERVTVGLDLPATTDFLAIIVSAVEDVCSTDVPPFQGHYADGVTLSVDAWIDVAPGTPGAGGVPQLDGFGTLGPGDVGSLVVSGVSGPALGVLSLAVGDVQPFPLFGGTLTAFPPAALPAFASASATVRLPYVVPGLAPGTVVTCQAVLADSSSPFGAVLTNAIEGLSL